MTLQEADFRSLPAAFTKANPANLIPAHSDPPSSRPQRYKLKLR